MGRALIVARRLQEVCTVWGGEEGYTVARIEMRVHDRRRERLANPALRSFGSNVEGFGD